jgi:2-dehydropantoate 2-reductase
MSSLKVLVLGTGAMASLVGAYLARSAEATVTLAGSWEAALSAIDRDGLTVLENGRSWNVRVRTAPRTARLTGFDVVIVLGKAFQTPELAHVAAAAVGIGGLVVTLQNGLGNREALEATVRRAHVAVGVTTLGATLLAPARVRACRGRIVLGVTDGNRLALRRLKRLLTPAGLSVTMTEAIEEHLWRKLAVNCAINPLSALLGVTNGALVENPESLSTMTAAAAEVADVARARGLALSPADAADLAVQVARDTADNRSSMLQDLTRRSRTEIDALNGAVCREARRLGVATPLNRRLHRDLKREERRLRITTDHTVSRPRASAGAHRKGVPYANGPDVSSGRSQ